MFSPLIYLLLIKLFRTGISLPDISLEISVINPGFTQRGGDTGLIEVLGSLALLGTLIFAIINGRRISKDNQKAIRKSEIRHDEQMQILQKELSYREKESKRQDRRNDRQISAIKDQVSQQKEAQKLQNFVWFSNMLISGDMQEGIRILKQLSDNNDVSTLKSEIQHQVISVLTVLDIASQMYIRGLIHKTLFEQVYGGLLKTCYQGAHNKQTHMNSNSIIDLAAKRLSDKTPFLALCELYDTLHSK